MPDRTSFHGGTESHQGAPGRLVLPATSAGGGEETGGRLLEARVGLGEAGQGRATGSEPAAVPLGRTHVLGQHRFKNFCA